MRSIALSLGAVCSVGVLVLGRRALPADRASREADGARADSGLIAHRAAPAAERLWYGGTLAPIVVEAPAVRKLTATPPCASLGG